MGLRVRTQNNHCNKLKQFCYQLAKCRRPLWITALTTCFKKKEADTRLPRIVIRFMRDAA